MHPKIILKYELVIGITQPSQKEGTWSAILSNLSKASLDNYGRACVIPITVPYMLIPSAVDLKLNFFLPNLARRAPLPFTS